LCCSLTPAFAESTTTEGEVLTVGVPTDRCPVFYLDAETGEPRGIGVDLVRAAGEEAGYAVDIKTVTEPNLKDALHTSAVS
jgi:ABC-type amino acid transport substrate-binding protein